MTARAGCGFALPDLPALSVVLRYDWPKHREAAAWK